ncbi:LAMI_0E07888g1_1 [Lachancea mirantina]|uniref:LAMI_0E07888g1_1 n=1 Tax=Lachancea mirantina TaxID=1230905 RepID=A0A1G4JML9_9SACH|nr:LAMI_0E07888g1_1 [Lachancea mirantina]
MQRKDDKQASEKPVSLSIQSVEGDDDEETAIFSGSQPDNLTYLRNQATFIDDGSTSAGDDFSHLVAHHASHNRRASNDRMLSMHLSQWNYNNNRVGLSRGITNSEELLNELAEENGQRSIFVPLDEPRATLHILDVRLKLDNGKHSKVDLDKNAVAKLFKMRTLAALKHLKSLQKRVDDTSSKVFITGDLNAGKSTFCNALLRRNILPVDQLPCTNVFCEILEARENSDVEEVHAIPIEAAATVQEATEKYNIRDKSTYKSFALKELPDLVYRSDEYSLLKIYIKDNKRPAESSLLRNGTVDISLIDSPGLNMDSIQTTEVMSRQEEIDLVIFVVNSENQLTLSGKEFISVASREKKLMFFVVNKFDQIRDKNRCKRLILDQIKSISPESHKNSTEFVHFVSSDSKPQHPSDDDPSDDDFDRDEDPDFDSLESSLRNFLLKKRSLSKLQPAKTYLVKLLQDMNHIAQWNLDLYQTENGSFEEELKKIQPELKTTTDEFRSLTDRVDKIVAASVSEVYEFTKNRINSCLESMADERPIYEGISTLHDYVFRTRQFIIDQVQSSVESSEMYSRAETERVVKEINTLGRKELGDNFMSNRALKSDLMFTKRKHLQLRKLNVAFDLMDFFSPTWEGFFRYLSWGSDVETETGNQISKDDLSLWQTILGINSKSLTKYWTTPSLVLTSKIPALAVYSWGGARVIANVFVYGSRFFSLQSIRTLSTYALLVGSVLGVAYIVHDLPRALPMNLSMKYHRKLARLDYAHSNSKRISDEMRDVLKFPTREIVKSCEAVIDKKQAAKRDIEDKLHMNNLSMKFFRTFLKRATEQLNLVEEINLDVD